MDCLLHSHLFLRVILIALALCGVIEGSPAANAWQYYQPQTNFAESTVSATAYHWGRSDPQACIYKDPSVPNSYYVWTKLAVQSWRQALREYSGNLSAWSLTARHVDNRSELESCTIKVFILASYKDFPG